MDYRSKREITKDARKLDQFLEFVRELQKLLPSKIARGLVHLVARDVLRRELNPGETARISALNL